MTPPPSFATGLPSIAGPFSLRGAAELEPYSAISQRDWGVQTVRGGVDLRKLCFLPRSVEVLEIWNDLRTGDGALSSPRVELAQYTTPTASQRPAGAGLGFPHRAGRYQPW